ncbi:uncharacterized protein ARMOST_13836 [Armillaria ostoyae]|uniref:Reverse transcriptase RNase H-like domain-containing protein n=1 Tax=Armillaria ostoyae TaxID=47428 RepID=A0A284RNX2_ARMOS|nr:uncharacterized protein ARMOST_13836 [Armillaria ostoyae]
MLSQQQEGKWQPVVFMSKALTATEQNYEIYDKELLAIMLALSKWWHYLMGTTEDEQQDNDNIIVLQPEHFRALILPTTHEAHQSVEDATCQEELWDQGIAASLAHK